MVASKRNFAKDEQILLMTLPFLTPVCPPSGISCLKAALGHEGYKVKTADAMGEMEIRGVCYTYFDKLESFVPEEKRGHFFNIGLDVINNHFMAHINYEDELKYQELIQEIVYQNFFVRLNDAEVLSLIEIVKEYYLKLTEYLVALIEKVKPSILGISVCRGTLASALFAFRLVKSKYSQIITLMGGTIFSQELFIGTPNYQLFMKKADCIDKILVGEGETLFLKYLRGELPTDKKVYTLEDIGNELLDLNKLEIPDYNDFDLSNYPLIPAYTSRGCVYQCSFCAETVFWKKYRKKDAIKIVDEFERLSCRYDKNILLLTDCLINPIVTDLAQEIINRDLSLYWDVYLKVDNYVCDPEYTFLWRRGGFYRARLGVESGSQRILDIIDKRITIEQIKKAISSLATAGIKTTTYWIAGHPGETEADFQQTLDLLEELADDIFEAEADPFRYFYSGQVDGDKWLQETGNSLLYPEEATEMLITQTWKLHAYPKREEIYNRACRFRQHCKKLGIPNPYSVSEIYKADERWRKLHKNAVPALMDLEKQELFLGENKRISPIIAAQKTNFAEADFAF